MEHVPGRTGFDDSPVLEWMEGRRFDSPGVSGMEGRGFDSPGLRSMEGRGFDSPGLDNMFEILNEERASEDHEPDDMGWIRDFLPSAA